MLPGLRLRQVRERLGPTYRDVETASYELLVRGSPNFIMHISRLADIENRNVVPGLHKFYTLAALYHLNPLELFRWFEIPIEECFGDGINFQVPRTHVAAQPSGLRVPLRFDPGFDRVADGGTVGHFEGALKRERPQHCYGYIGLTDRRMAPLLRPGSLVLVDTEMREIEVEEWTCEHDRPMYLVERLSVRVVSSGTWATVHGAASIVAVRSGILGFADGS